MSIVNSLFGGRSAQRRLSPMLPPTRNRTQGSSGRSEPVPGHLALRLSDYCVVDTETTGLNGSIIQIGAVKVINGEVVDVFDTVMTPQKGDYIEPRAYGVHRISANDLEGAPTVKEAMELFLEFIGELPIIGHNFATFDKRMIEASLHSVGLKWTNDWVDTLELSRSVHILQSHTLDRLTEFVGLDRLMRVPSKEQPHRALGDAWRTCYIYEDMKRQVGHLDEGGLARFEAAWKRFEPSSGIVRTYRGLRPELVGDRVASLRGREVLAIHPVPAGVNPDAGSVCSKSRLITNGMAVSSDCDQVVLTDDAGSRWRYFYAPSADRDREGRLLTLNQLQRLESYVVVYSHRASSRTYYEIGAVKVQRGSVKDLFASYVNISQSSRKNIRDNVPQSLLNAAPGRADVAKELESFAAGLPLVVMDANGKTLKQVTGFFEELCMLNSWVDLAQLASISHRGWNHREERKAETLLAQYGIMEEGQEIGRAVNMAWMLTSLFGRILYKEGALSEERNALLQSSWSEFFPTTSSTGLPLMARTVTNPPQAPPTFPAPRTDLFPTAPPKPKFPWD